MNPLHPAIDPETGKEYEKTYPNGVTNPDYYNSKRVNKKDRYGLLSSLFVEIEPIRNLKFTSRAGIDGYISLYNQTGYPSWEALDGNGYKMKYTDFDYSATITNTLEYSFNIGHDHQFVILAGQEGVNNYYDYYEASSEGITDDRLTNLQNGEQASYSVGESMSQSKFLSFFGRIDYALMDKYYFDASIRNDACSRFGANNRNATFWAAGAMWRMKREGFLQNAYWLTDLNAKVSYGTQGNASIGDYKHLALLASSSDYAESSSMVVGQPANPGLTWEKQALFTVGINGRLIDRIDFNIEYYNRKTSSMLMSVPYNYTTGFSSLYANVGGLLNQGIDLTLGVDILRGKDYYFRASTTFNYNAEKVTELFNDLDRWEMVGYGFAYVVDQPVSYYSPIFAGIDPEDGAPTWYLPYQNEDGTYDPDRTCMDPERITKKYDETTLTQNTGKRMNAPIYGGFSFSGGWRGISLQADFSYVLGKTLINNDAYFYANPGLFPDDNQHKSAADFWTPENTDAAFPDWSKYNMEMDTHLYENANFLRLKNLQVAYDLPRRYLGNQNVINGLKISFTGRNLWTVTKYGGIDPEVNSNLSRGIMGNSKQFLFGLELTF